MVPRRLSGGWRRHRPTARPLTDGADVVQYPRDFRWTAPTSPNCLASFGGQRRCRSAAPRFPTDGVSPLNNPRDSQRTALHRPTVLHPPLADVVDTTRRPFDPPADADIIVAGCTRGASIRATGALRLAADPPNSALPAARQMARGVFPSASEHGNESPSCIP